MRLHDASSLKGSGRSGSSTRLAVQQERFAPSGKSSCRPAQSALPFYYSSPDWGPEAVLKRAAVPVLHELPGVGANLKDHLEAYLQYACLEPITLNGKIDLFNKAVIGAEWLL